MSSSEDEVPDHHVAQLLPVVPHPGGLALQTPAGYGGSVLSVPAHVVAEDAGPLVTHLCQAGVGQVSGQDEVTLGVEMGREGHHLIERFVDHNSVPLQHLQHVATHLHITGAT